VALAPVGFQATAVSGLVRMGSERVEPGTCAERHDYGDAQHEDPKGMEPSEARSVLQEAPSSAVGKGWVARELDERHGEATLSQAVGERSRG